MADGSKLPFEENVALVGARVEQREGLRRCGRGRARPHRGRRGRRPGGGGRRTHRPRRRPVRFVAMTEADCLAVSIGNVPGAYREEPMLDWERLEAIESAVSVPLSLHGASGGRVRCSPCRRLSGSARSTSMPSSAGPTWTSPPRALSGPRDGQRVMALHAARAPPSPSWAAAKIESFTAVVAMTPLRRLDHVAVAVRDTEDALEYFRASSDSRSSAPRRSRLRTCA